MGTNQNRELINGKITCASYTYICEDDIEPYNSQLFEKENKVYKINNTLEVLPTICENHRILVLDANGDLYYDSMDIEEYKPIESGFINSKHFVANNPILSKSPYFHQIR